MFNPFSKSHSQFIPEWFFGYNADMKYPENGKELYLAYRDELLAIAGNKHDPEISSSNYDIFINEPYAESHFKFDGDKCIGFIFLSQIGDMSEPYETRLMPDWFIQDSYIIPQCRRHGIMFEFAKSIIADRPGTWGLCIIDKNISAKNLWQKVVSSLGSSLNPVSSGNGETVYSFEIE